jgi:hypothetical protein
MADFGLTQASTDGNGRFNKASHDKNQAEFDSNVDPTLRPEIYHEPKFFVYVYSVVDQRPQGEKLVRMLPPLLPRLEIAELKEGEKWTLAATIPHPINQHDSNLNGERFSTEHSALRMAMDIVNPANYSLDQDRKPNSLTAVGDNYGVLGVFWSRNYPPTEEEVNKAIARKEAFYRERLDMAGRLEVSNPKALQEFISINDHIAADYFGLQFSWHKSLTKSFACEQCGEQIKNSEIAFHPMTSVPGVLCIRNWQKAVDAGVKTKADVPEGKRWWGKAKELHEEVRA